MQGLGFRVRVQGLGFWKGFDWSGFRGLGF